MAANPALVQIAPGQLVPAPFPQASDIFALTCTSTQVHWLVILIRLHTRAVCVCETLLQESFVLKRSGVQLELDQVQTQKGKW